MKYEIGDKLKERSNGRVRVVTNIATNDRYWLDDTYCVSEKTINDCYDIVELVERVPESENEVKARELAKGRCIILTEMRQKECSYEGDYEWEEVKHPIHKQCEQVALEMAEWKDSEFEKEKARWIENAWNWLTEQKGERTIDDFKKAMKGE